MRRLILHIGNPKAGSTSLQNFLFDNRAKLLERGILFPVMEGENAQSHATLPRSLSGQTPVGMGAMTWAALEREIAASPAPVVVVSSEFFVRARMYPAIVEAVNKVARRAGMAVTVAAFIRPQHLWINSSYTQNIKTLQTALGFPEFCERCQRLMNFDLMAAFGVWMDNPASEFTAIPFTASQLGQGLERAFFAAVGLPDEVMGISGMAPVAVVNRSPGPMTVEVSHQVALGLRKNAADIGARRKFARKVITRTAELHGWDETSYSGLSPSLKETLWRHFTPSNRQFARRVWRRDWDDVFEGDLRREVAPNEIREATCPGDDWRLLCETVYKAQLPGGRRKQTAMTEDHDGE